MKKLLLAYSLVLLCSCSPRITTSLIKKEKPLSKNSIVIVYDKNDTLPSAFEKLGTVQVADPGLNSKSYYIVFDAAKLEARKAGGNAIQILKLRIPNIWNSAYSLTASILNIDTSLIHLLVKPLSVPDIVKMPISHWRLALNGGYAYNLGKDAPTFDTRIQTYNNQMRSSLNFGAEINYFVVNGQMGIGVNYETVSSQNSLSGVTYLSSGQIFSNNNVSDNLNIQYIGPMYTGISRQIKKNGIKNALIINVGMGNLSYTDTKIVDLRNYKISGSALGTYYSIGYDHFISKNMALGIQLSLITGLLTNYDRFDGTSTTHVQLDNNSYQSLTHISLTVGLRFNTSK
jgi:hypothetical protein